MVVDDVQRDNRSRAEGVEPKPAGATSACLRTTCYMLQEPTVSTGCGLCLIASSVRRIDRATGNSGDTILISAAVPLVSPLDDVSRDAAGDTRHGVSRSPRPLRKSV